MKELFLFLLLLFVITTAGSVEVNESSTAAAGDPSTNVKYHGGVRYWTTVDPDGRTYLSLNILKEAVNGSAKLLFPKEKTVAQILSDLTLFSPTNAEDECITDNSKLEFKLKFDNENWIHGEVTGEYNIVTAYLYPKCPRSDGTRYYATNPIDENEANFVYRGRLCFQQKDLFQSYGATNKNMMELQVSESFKCNVFLIMPNYMVVEDEVLKDDIREPLNSTFAAQGEEFWWKSGNSESLSDGIAFVEHDVVVNISKSTKELPYFLRIGEDQPYPSLNFNYDSTCTNQQFELFVNLRENVDCRIVVKLVDDGFQLTTKGGVSPVIQNGTKSLTMIFARGQSKVYVKDGLFIVPLEVCQIENMPDVPSDQFVLQISPSESSASCALAQVILPAEDVKSKIEVLVDRVKAAERVGKANETDYSTSTSASGIIGGETTAVAQAGSEWWWYVIAGVVSVILIVAAIIGICYFVHRRRKQKEKERNKALAAAAESKSKLNNDRKNEKQKPTQKTETTVPIEEPPKKTKKKKAKKDKKKKKRGTTEEESEKSTKKTEEEEKQNHYELLPPCPPTNGPPRSPGKLTQESTVQATQEETTLGTGSTQNPTKQTGPGKPTLQTRTTQQPTMD